MCVSHWGSHSKWGCLWFLPERMVPFVPETPRDMRDHVSGDLGVSEVVWVLSCWLEVPLPDIKHPPLDLRTLLMLNWRSSGGLSQGMKGRLSFNLLFCTLSLSQACLMWGGCCLPKPVHHNKPFDGGGEAKDGGRGTKSDLKGGRNLKKKCLNNTPEICLRGRREKRKVCVIS